ncbi:hypothetical protein ACFX13_004084 [Malus domestica]
MGRTGLFDLERHFAFYGAYHSNPVNVLLHTFLVWPLIFTLDVLLNFTPPLYNFPSGLNYHGFELNVGLVLTLMYAIVCVKLDKKAGSLAALLLFLTRVGASVLANGLGFAKSWKLVLAVQAFCWPALLIGHGVFEKRIPGLADSFFEGFMEPYYVLLEFLQSAFGYEPYPGFNKSVKEKIEADIKSWKIWAFMPLSSSIASPHRQSSTTDLDYLAHRVSSIGGTLWSLIVVKVLLALFDMIMRALFAWGSFTSFFRLSNLFVESSS